MKIYKVTYAYNVPHPVYFVVDELDDLQVLSKRYYQDLEIQSIHLESSDVINQWAQ